MYRTLIPKTLNAHQTIYKNRDAVGNVRYCNGFCQDYVNREDMAGLQALCKICRNKVGLAKKLIDNNTITVEQFIKDPTIIYPNTPDLQLEKKFCTSCKEYKSVDLFREFTRKCKACLALINNSRIDKDYKKAMEDIKKIKNNIAQLSQYVKRLSSAVLKQIITNNEEMGRSSTDTKGNHLDKIIAHYRSKIDADKCEGGCGLTMSNKNTTCKSCEKKYTKVKLSLTKWCDTVLPDYAKTLKNITEEEATDLTIKQLFCLAKYLDISVKSGTPKNSVVEIINEHLQTKESSLVLSVKKDDISLDISTGYTIKFRHEDGYINITNLCKFAKKPLKSWRRIGNTKEFIKELAEDTGIPENILVKIGKGNTSTWVHPQVAINIAQWISPKFNVKVSKWVFELMVNGTTTFNSTASSDKLLEQLRTENYELKNSLRDLEITHNNSLARRRQHMLKNGPCFYIISSVESPNKVKVGMSEDINRRLADHRITILDLKVEYIVYTSSYKYLERNILDKYKENRNPHLNHEWIYNVDVSDIIESTRNICDFLNYSITEADDNDISLYNKFIVEKKDE